eukprot:13654961-Alexandrium_andersonii.AAC.1
MLPKVASAAFGAAVAAVLQRCVCLLGCVLGEVSRRSLQFAWPMSVQMVRRALTCPVRLAT